MIWRGVCHQAVEKGFSWPFQRQNRKNTIFRFLRFQWLIAIENGAISLWRTQTAGKLRFSTACYVLFSLAFTSVALADGVGGDGYARWQVNGFEISEPLAGLNGDPARGRAIASDGRRGNCLACHRLPVAGLEAQGNLGPPLAGIGARQSRGMLRLHVVDQSRFNPETVMPGFHRRPEQLHRVARAYVGKPFLTAQQIEDVVAWLTTLR